MAVNNVFSLARLANLYPVIPLSKWWPPLIVVGYTSTSPDPVSNGRKGVVKGYRQVHIKTNVRGGPHRSIGGLRQPCVGSGWWWSVQLFTVWHTVRVKKVAPPPETFCNIFTQAKYISVKFCHFVTSVYPPMFTSFGRYILIFNKIALIFLGVVIVFTASSFEFQQDRLPWLHR